MSNKNQKDRLSGTTPAETSAESPNKDGQTPGSESNKTQHEEKQDGSDSTSSASALETEKDGPLYKFFTNGLKDIYFAEKEIKEALKKMQEAATTEELKEAFEDHELQTMKHISRLEKVFRLMGEDPEAKKCEAILGILREGETVTEETEEGSMTRDAALIIAAQKVEHYEIASYGGLAALAETLGLSDASNLLHRTLEEEERTDHTLTDIAESFINFAAKEDDNEVQKSGSRHKGSRQTAGY